MQKVFDRARQLILPDNAERDEAMNRFVRAERRRMAATGQTGAGVVHIRDYCAKDLGDRAAFLHETLVRVHKALAPPWTESAAADLKKEAIVYLNDARLTSQEVVRQEFQRLTGRAEIVPEINLDMAYARERDRLSANIDLYVDSYAISAVMEDTSKVSRAEKTPASSFIDPARLAAIQALPKGKFDFSRLAALCMELNECAARENAHAVIMLTRGLLDHVPPIFGAKDFGDLANHHAPSRSFKDAMLHLDKGSRKIADLHLHTQIRSEEVVPNMTQVNFSGLLDLLLSEIERLSKAQKTG